MAQLSILICGTTERIGYLARLLTRLDRQVARFGRDIEVLISVDGGEKSIGGKRNELLAQAGAPYLCFIDDDDLVAPTYIEDILAALDQTPDADCVALEGIITFDGAHPQRFVNSLAYTTWHEADGVFYRCPNHLNTVKTTIARQVPFQAISYGEDRDWSFRLRPLLHIEAPIFRTMYYYEHRTKPAVTRRFVP